MVKNVHVMSNIYNLTFCQLGYRISLNQNSRASGDDFRGQRHWLYQESENTLITPNSITTSESATTILAAVPSTPATRQENINTICATLDLLEAAAFAGDERAAQLFDLIWESLMAMHNPFGE